MGLLWRLPVALALVLFAAWAGGALYFRAPFPPPGNAALALGLAGLLLACGWALLRRRAKPAIVLVSVAASAAFAGWYATIHPSDSLNWAPDVARRSLVHLEGDVIRVKNLRDFDWQGENHGIARWEDRNYALSQLQTLDIFLSYWSGPTIAHLITSFGFSDGRKIAFSTEIRKQVGQDYDPLAGFFRSYTLALIAAEERDVIKVRTNWRGEDVFRYRLDLKPETVRLLFADYAALTQKLEAQPEFYNTLLDNCSMVPFRMVRLRDPKAIPFDWRILTVGALPEYLLEQGFLDPSTLREGLRERARITLKARAAETAPDFSAAIRTP
jgi:hypothetical protein